MGLVTASKIYSDWPARGGLVTDGSLETWSDTSTLTHWTKSGSGTLTRTSAGANVKQGSYAAVVKTGSSSEPMEIYQDVSVVADAYGGYQLTAMAWVKASHLGGYVFISTETGEILARAQHSGGGSWEMVRVSAVIPSGHTRLRVGYRWTARVASENSYVDAFSCLLGDTYYEVEINGKNIFPVDLPENVLSTTGTTVDGKIYGCEDGIVIVDRTLKFEAVTGNFYRKMKYFYRYVAAGSTYEIKYVDEDGYEYDARMLSGSLSDAQMIASDLYSFSIGLRLTDKGII